MRNRKGKQNGVSPKAPLGTQFKPKQRTKNKKNKQVKINITEAIKTAGAATFPNNKIKIEKKEQGNNNQVNPQLDTIKTKKTKKPRKRNKIKKNKRLGNSADDPKPKSEETTLIFNTKNDEADNNSASENDDVPVPGRKGQMQAKKKPKRFVLFVGNLPFDVTEQDIHEHFKKAAVIKNIRLPKPKVDGEKPRGIAFIDLNNEVEYQKCLSMHNTFIGNRKINVLYSEGKSKNPDRKSKEKVKNMKLHAMAQKGLLNSATTENRKRSARRAKQRFFEKKMKEGAQEEN